MTKNFCDICKQAAPNSLRVELSTTHGEVTIVAKVHFFTAPLDMDAPVPDICDRCLVTILEDLSKKYSAAG